MTIVLLTAAADTAEGPLQPSTPIVIAAGSLLVANADGPANLLDSLSAWLADTNGNVVVTATATTITQDSDLGNGLWRYTARLVTPITPGDYQIVWQESDSGQETSEPVTVTTGVRPSIESVAALLRARTKVKGGTEAGTFNSQTRPTDAQVDELIDEALNEVGGKVQPVDPTLPPGDPMGPGSAYERRYSGAVRLYTAILIELSYFPEQVRQNLSPVATFQQLYDLRIRALIAEGEHQGQPEGMGEGGAGSGGAGDAPADAAWAFPAAAPGAMVGWASRW